MTNRLMAAAIAVTFGLPVAGHSMSKGDYKGEQERIGAQLRAAQQKCEKLAGNAKDICVAKAEGTGQVAKAELDARHKGYSPEARHDVRMAKAEAEYGVAKEKCDDLAGNAKDLCQKNADAALNRAKSDAAADHNASAASQASRDQVADASRDSVKRSRKAEYDAAVERCNTETGNARKRCVAETKARFGLQ